MADRTNDKIEDIDTGFLIGVVMAAAIIQMFTQRLNHDN